MKDRKFRVWDGKEMHYQGVFQVESYHDPLRGWMNKEYFFPFEGIESGSIVAGEALEEFTVMEWTGLSDRNGKAILEGDIVVKDGYLWFDGEAPNYRGTVEWIFSQWQVVAHCVNPAKSGISNGINEGLNDEGFDEGEKSDWEVLGNIHEHPELLKL